jgi:hypothetical protein
MWMGEPESLTKEHGSMVHISRMTGVCSGNIRTPGQHVLASESATLLGANTPKQQSLLSARSIRMEKKIG